MIRLTSQKLLPILLVFLIFIALTLNPAFAQSPLNVTVKTDKVSYQLRNNVNIFGNVTYNGKLVSSGLAGIQVKGPQGTFVARVRPVGLIGSQSFVMEIIQVTLSDQHGNPQKTIIRGNTAYFTVIVRNKGITDRIVTITLNIYDNDTIPIGFMSLSVQIVAGGTCNSTRSLDIQSWAKNGTATIYADVWDSLPESNGIIYCPEKASTFAILESQYDETLPKQASPQPIQNGTFTIGFRLSPEPKNGTYTVYATATSKDGWTPDQRASTTFQVVDVVVPPRASFVMMPPLVAPNCTMTFDASPSTPEGYNQTITNYAWNFGDGQTGTGQTVSHSYPTVGNRMVTLNVTSSRGLWNTTTRTAVIKVVHNVAVVSVSCFNGVYNDWMAPVSVTLKNEGTVSETLNVTLYVNDVLNKTKIIKNNSAKISDFAPYTTNSITITWDTTGLLPGHNYTIAAVSDTLPNETNTTDNTQQYGPIFVGLLGDIDFDRKITILDVVRVTAIYGAKAGDSNWDIMCDLYVDGQINILDVVAVTSRYQQKY
jgi:hypothetical protein